MSLHLITENEQLEVAGDGYKIFYRRLPGHIATRLTRKNTKRGQLDSAGFSEDVLNYAITGWEGVQRDGVDVPFDPELIRWIPATVQGEVIEKSTEEIHKKKEAEAKN